MEPIRKLIDGEEVKYKMLEILPPFGDAKWYEFANPKEIKELVDELYNIVQCQPTIEVQGLKYLNSDNMSENKWISNKERTPNNNGIYLAVHIYYTGYIISILLYRGTVWIDERGHYIDNKAVKYWQPVPELPNELR